MENKGIQKKNTTKFHKSLAISQGFFADNNSKIECLLCNAEYMQQTSATHIYDHFIKHKKAFEYFENCQSLEDYQNNYPNWKELQENQNEKKMKKTSIKYNDKLNLMKESIGMKNYLNKGNEEN